jgi:ribulose-phosphate 3-epimerase
MKPADGASDRERGSHANGAPHGAPASARAEGSGPPSPQRGLGEVSPEPARLISRAQADGAKPPGWIMIAPSLLSADFARLGDAVALAERGGADLIHFDVMDGHFVPNITIGPPVLKALARVSRLPIDVHLMIEHPDRFVEAFAEAGAASITVHVEAVVHLHRVVHLIKSLGVKAGVALNPATPVSALDEIAGDVDYVLVMTVNPGFGGQTFIPRSESKVRAVRELLRREGSSAPIEVDGGIDVHTAPRIVAAGAEILVAGNAVFGSPDPERAIRDLRAAASAAVPF